MEKKTYIGIDLGATNLHFVLINQGNKILQEKVTPTPKETKKAINLIIATIKNFVQKTTAGIGIAIAGLVNQKEGVIYFAPNLGWRNVKLIKKIKRYFPELEIVLENDANAAAWGAYFLLGKRKIKNLICLTLGTGLGGGIIIDGKLYRGVNGTAGEIGHITINPQGLRCNCGNYGCIERYIGANYLVAEVKKEIKQNKKSVISKMVNYDLRKITPEIIALAAKKGDKLAKNIWENVGEKLGIILTGVINLLNPEMIVLSGGISGAVNFFIKELKGTLKKRAFAQSLKRVKIVVGKKNLGVIGVALLAKENN